MNSRLIIASILTIGAGGPVISCDHGEKKSDSSVEFLGQALRTGNGIIKPDDREIVVYYANESDPTEEDLNNFNKIILALKGDKRTEHMALKIETDKAAFGKLVDGEVAALSAQLCSPANKNGVGLIVFDNRYAKQGKYRYCEAGQGLKTADSKDYDTVLKAAGNDFRIKSHPLVSKAGLTWALKQIPTVFPGKDPLLSLILRSHGSDQGDLLLTPRIALNHAKLNGNDAARSREIQEYGIGSKRRSRVALGKKCATPAVATLDKGSFNKAGFDKDAFDKDAFDKDAFDKDAFDKDAFDKDGFNKAGFDKDGFDKGGFDKDGFDKDAFDKDGFDKDGFDKDAFDKDGFDKDGFGTIGELAKDVPGLTKADFLKVLSQSGMRYGIVATLSCYSTWSALATAEASLPIEWLVGAAESERGIPYEALDFKALLANQQEPSGKKIAMELKDFLWKVSENQKQKYASSVAKMCQSRRK